MNRNLDWLKISTLLLAIFLVAPAVSQTTSSIPPTNDYWTQYESAAKKHPVPEASDYGLMLVGSGLLFVLIRRHLINKKS
jgi:hypothetical protein